ncbi:hypothetical protein [Nocardia flavorosea]|uniref:Uncharacterized protein n=1 Tax=Nocardia flavorosea TaxID=53429 RepID=A0A846YTJ1_9NOCA|nr:hypothetical protein [Nocardia flavorosea]NKY60794.1 hypothetical protein [Nocardia flavorosea]
MTITSGTRRTKRYRYRKANNIQVYTDTAPIQEHIRSLTTIGINYPMIAASAGCTKQCIRYIDIGAIERVRVELAAAIRATTHHPHPKQNRVLGIGAARRLRALNAIGWSTTLLADRLGIDVSGLNLCARRKHVTYQRWAEIRDLYNALSGTPGPSRKSIQVARAAGHVPPLAWDGIDIDDPRAQPDWIAAGIKVQDRPVCVNNHPRTPANTVTGRRGHRACAECMRGQRERAAARRQQTAA